MTGCAQRVTLVYLASHIAPAHTGGEQYNLHLLAAAEKAGIDLVTVALSDNRLYQRLNDTRGLWRLCRPLGWVWFHWQMIRYRSEWLLVDGWLAPLLWPGVRWLPLRYLVMVHHLTAELCASPLRRRWRAFCEAQLLGGAQRILTVSRSSREQIRRRVSGDPSIDVINTAFEPTGGVSQGGGDTLRILYVGHLTRAKGVIELLQAVARLPTDRAWRLEMVGRDSVEPDTTRQIRQLCRQYQLDTRVTLHGRLDDAALQALYLASDIFVLPSHWEGYGIVLLEAMSHGVAVVATTAGAIPEVVRDGDTGLLVPAGDPVALHDALLRLMEDQPLRLRLAKAGLAFAQRHPDWQAMEQVCVEWWRTVLGTMGAACSSR